jgi:hypothetical protein
MRKFLTGLTEYYEQGGLKPFRALISKSAQKSLAPKLGRSWASIDERELLFLLGNMCGARSAADPFQYRSALKLVHMTNSVWSSVRLDEYLGEQAYLEEVHRPEANAISIEAHLRFIWQGFRCSTFQARM